MEIPKSLVILREACARNNVTFEVVDGFSGFVARITRNNKSLLVGAAGLGVYPLNRAAPFAVARDKAFTHYVLVQAGFHAPEGEHFFLNHQGDYVRPPGRERADGIRFARKFSDGFAKPLIVKPNSGKGAKLVTFVRSEVALDAALDAIAEIDDVVLIQSFVDVPEYRLFLIDGEIAFAYRKQRTTITGDGQKTVAALCADASVGNTDYLNAQLEAQQLTPEDVLDAGRVLAVDFIANISASGRFAGFVEPSAAVRDWARRVARTVSLRVTGLDIFSRSALADPDDFIITDVNGAPNLGTLYDLGHRALVFDVWKSILDKTFDEPWPEEF